MKTTKPWWRRIWDALTGEPTGPANGANVPEQKSTPKMPPVKPARDEPYMYVTKTGRKFHYDADCQALQNTWARGEVIKIMVLSKARASGRTACSRCCWDYLHK